VGCFKGTDPDTVFTPGARDEEHRRIGKTTREFMRDEVLPGLERLENKDWGLARRLLVRCGELGLLARTWPKPTVVFSSTR